MFNQFSIFFNYLFRYEFSDSRRVFWCVTWLYLKKIFFWFYSWGWKTLIANPPGQNSSNQKSIKLKVACNGQPQRNLKCNIWFSKKWENQPTLMYIRVHQKSNFLEHRKPPPWSCSFWYWGHFKTFFDLLGWLFRYAQML